MADVKNKLSLGQQLLALGIRQGASFQASTLPEEHLRDWADYRSEPELRKKPIKASALLVVVSQDCDIACPNHSEDPCIELAVFNPIKPKRIFEGNQFAHSVRKLQLHIDDQPYEAKARETIRVPKQALNDTIEENSITSLSSIQCRTLVLWRANRYQREAFPDRFVRAFMELIDQALPELSHIARIPGDDAHNYIRSLYVFLNNTGEEGRCGFSLMLLLREDTPDEVQSELDDSMDDVCQELEARNPDFYLIEDDHDLAGLAEKESTVTVATLGRYIKFNLDSASLSQGDPDTGVSQ